MKVTKENLEGSRVRLEIEAPASVVEEGLTKAYRDLNRRVSIPGFRKGKAPRHLVERFYKDSLYQEAEMDVLPEQYIKAVEETDTHPIDEPSYSDISFEKGEPLKFTATVYVRPEVTLEDYSAISVPFETPTMSDEETEEQFAYLKERMAELRPLPEDSVLEKGHFATCHVKGIPGGDTEVAIDQDLTYIEVGGDFAIIPGLGEAILGMKKDEEKEFVGTYKRRVSEKEEETEDESPKEETANFKVVVKELYEKHVPSDDEVVKGLGKGSVEEAKEDIKQRFLEIRMNEAHRKHSSEVEDNLLKLASVDIPEVMVQRRANSILEDLLERLEEAGRTLDGYLESLGKTVDDLKEEAKTEAEIDVKRDLVLDEVSKREGTEVPEESVNAVLSQIASQTGQEVDAVRTTLKIRGGYESLMSDLSRAESLKKLAILAADNAGTPLPLQESKKDEPGEEDAAVAEDNQE